APTTGMFLLLCHGVDGWRSRHGARRCEGFLQLLRVLVGQRRADHGPAVLRQRGDRLVRSRLLDDHEQRRGPGLEVVAHLLLERLVDALLTEVPEQSPHSGADRQARERDEEQQAEQHAPETAPHGTAPCGCAAVGGVNVVLALEVPRDRGDLIGLDDQFAFERAHRLAGLLGGSLVRIPNRNQRCHQCSFGWFFCTIGGSPAARGRASPKPYEPSVAVVRTTLSTAWAPHCRAGWPMRSC